MKKSIPLCLAVSLCIGIGTGIGGRVMAAPTAAVPGDGAVLPFPPVPSASVAKPRLQDSVHKRRAQPDHLKPGAPNVLIILLDDVGFGQASTFGGEMNTPALTRLANQGISYNTFHTTAICSPTRAALLTGRNHQRVGNGTIAERAVDWDGYTGVIPKTSATMAEVLRHYGYRTAAFGKWHNTPADQTTAMGPADRARLRLLLRFPRRRNVAMGTAAGREHNCHRTPP
jgi:arylsulfatase